MLFCKAIVENCPPGFNLLVKSLSSRGQFEETVQQKISMENLSQLIDRLAGVFLPAANRNQSYFVNEVPGDLAIGGNPQYIAPVLSRMISTIVNHVKNTSIRFSAKKNGHVVVLEIQESGSENGFALASELQQVNSLAERIGGWLSISLPRSQTTSIAFSFPDEIPADNFH